VLLGIVALSVAPSYWAATSGGIADQEFSWEVFGVVATSISTSLLAAFTVILAYSTSRDVRLQYEDQKLHRTPRVMLSRTEVRPAAHGELAGSRQADTWVALEIVNAGEGPAIDVTFDTGYTPDAGVPRLVNTGGRLPVILPGA
jgi:hypothetical protein